MERVLADAYSTCNRWMEFLSSKVSEYAEGILTPYIKHRGRFLGDWAAPDERKEWGESQEALLFNNCVYALDLEMMVDIAEALNKKDDATLYAARLKELREKIHKRFFDAGKKVYLEGRQVHLAFPLYVGVVPEDVEVPPNSTAEIHLPTGDRSSISESGKSLDTAAGVTFLRIENGRVVLSVGSGH